MTLKNGVGSGEAICDIKVTYSRTQENGHHPGNKPSGLQVFSGLDQTDDSKEKKYFGDGLPHFGRSVLIDEDEYFNYKITKFLFSNSLRKSILESLEEKGITKEFLFPDFSKICEEIKDDIYSKF